MNRLPFVQRVLLHGALLSLLATGVAWEWFSPGPWAAFLMKIHGAVAMLALILVGMLLVNHIPAGWGSLKNRWTGVLLLAGSAWLAVYCQCERPIPEERATRHGAARTHCARCDRELPLRFGGLR